MISDVLSDAIREIRRYQRDFECYRNLKPELDALVERMDVMRALLDTSDEELFTQRLARVRSVLGNRNG